MSKPPVKAEEFLRAMSPEPEASPSMEAPPPASPPKRAAAPAQSRAALRSGLKHIGGYLDDDTVEKVAVLRARLKLDNSELLKLAIEELHRKHTAKRSFGDV